MVKFIWIYHTSVKQFFLWALKVLSRAGKAMYSTEVKERSASIKNGRRVPTAWDLHYYWVKNCRGRWKNKEGWRAVRKNSGTLETDLKTEEKGNLPLQIYCGRRVTKVWSVSGWCSGLCWCRSEGRGRWQSSRAWASWGRRRQKGKREKGPRALFIEERVKRQARESRSLKRQNKCACCLDFRDNH